MDHATTHTKDEHRTLPCGCEVSAKLKQCPFHTDLVIERLPDWNWAAFRNETDASCIALGDTAEQAYENGMRIVRSTNAGG